jgi:hypothetical protein
VTERLVDAQPTSLLAAACDGADGLIIFCPTRRERSTIIFLISSGCLVYIALSR